MESFSGYLYAEKIIGQLPENEMRQCLLGLKYEGNGQTKAHEGNFEGARIDCQNAEPLFREVPKAFGLLGICCTDLAEIYIQLAQKDVNVNMEYLETAESYALEAIRLISNEKALIKSKASAFMSAGTVYYLKHKPKEGKQFFNEARLLFNLIPNGNQYLNILDFNEKRVLRFSGNDEQMPNESIKNNKGCFVSFLFFSFFA